MLLAALSWGCQPVIGDRCALATDCSTRGDRQCDTSQPGGYCTVPNCRGNGCPDKAACVLYSGRVPGCAYDDRSLARTAHAFCSASCESKEDCRAGYVCADPTLPPWNGIVLDDLQNRRTCLVDKLVSIADPRTAEPGVCAAAGPDTPEIEAGAGAIQPWDAGIDAPADAPSDAPSIDATAADAGPEAGDAAADVRTDGPDAG